MSSSVAVTAGSKAVYLHDAYCGTAPVVLPAPQVHQLMKRGDILVNAKKATGQAAGMTWQANGSVTLTEGGRYRVLSTQSTDKSTLHNAQFICGVLGLVLINLILYFDNSSRIANIKDFTINFSSDILAVGVILLFAEWIDRHKKSNSSGLREEGEDDDYDDDHVDLHRQPLQSAL